MTLRYDLFKKERKNCSPIAVLGGSLDGEREPKLFFPSRKWEAKAFASFATDFATDA